MPLGHGRTKRGLSPVSINSSLHYWSFVPNYLANCAIKERQNPFPGIDMNWEKNRAQFSVQTLLDSTDRLEDKMRVMESFKAFSLSRQLAPLLLKGSHWKSIFKKIFKGVQYAGWARQPGSWWAQRKRVFSGEEMRGLPFVDWLDDLVEDIRDVAVNWRDKSENTGWRNPLKRKSQLRFRKNDVKPPARKKFKGLKGQSEQIMSEEWRKRRREQEKRAGRWTDGTLRMDRMWAEFHWVLPTEAENFKDIIWDKPLQDIVIIEVSGSDIWGQGY